MTGFIESASAILSVAERRLEIVAQNTANAATPGYRRRASFQTYVAERSGIPFLDSSLDVTLGNLISTDRPTDLALAGPGVFIVRDGSSFYASRGGQFSRDNQGRLVNSAGQYLQQSGGGDIIVDTGSMTVSADGVVTDHGEPIARIGVYSLDSSSVLIDRAMTAAELQALPEADDPRVRQGSLEQSNVTLSDEMISIMSIARSSEAGARLVQVYDDLTGKFIASVGSVLR